MAKQKKKAAKKGNSANIGYEAQLWQMADALRGSMDAAEYKRVCFDASIGLSPGPARPPL